MIVPWLANRVLQTREVFESFSLFVGVREDSLELRKECLGILALRGASLLLEVPHPRPLTRREGVVNSIPVIALGKRWF